MSMMPKPVAKLGVSVLSKLQSRILDTDGKEELK